MDRQQWVKELRHRVNEANGEYYDVIELDFDEVDEIIEIIEDAITLLKEQEPAAPGILQDLEGIWSTCPRCKSKLWLFFGMTMEINPDHMPKYCPQCGKPIKWEGKTI